MNGAASSLGMCCSGQRATDVAADAADAYECLDGRRAVDVWSMLPCGAPAVLLSDAPSAAPLVCRATRDGQVLHLTPQSALENATSERAVVLMRMATGSYLFSGPLRATEPRDAAWRFGPVTHAMRVQSRNARRVSLPGCGSGVTLCGAQGEVLTLIDLSEGGAAIRGASIRRTARAGSVLTLNANGTTLVFRVQRIVRVTGSQDTVGIAWEAQDSSTMQVLRRLLNQLEVRFGRRVTPLSH
jgi:hypothetical protein